MLIFGYGSLLNAKYCWRKGMYRSYNFSDLTPAILQGYRREWNNSWKSRELFLGLSLRQGSYVNGIIFELAQCDISAWCASECIGRDDDFDTYKLVEVSDQIRMTPTRAKKFGRRPIYTCVTRRPSSKGKIAPEYIEKIKGGLEHWGKTFTETYMKTTYPAPFGLR